MENIIYPHDCDEHYNTHYFIFNRQQMNELADASKQIQGVQVSYSMYWIYRIIMPPIGKCCFSLNGLQRSFVNFKVNAVQFHPGLIVQNIQYILLMRLVHVHVNSCNNYTTSGRWDHVSTMYVLCEKKSGGKEVGVVVDLKTRTSCYPSYLNNFWEWLIFSCIIFLKFDRRQQQHTFLFM